MLRLIPLCFVLLFIACSNEVAHNVDGTYELIFASRNNKVTGSLDGAYMTFIDDNNMETNILGDTIICKFRISDSILIQESTPALSYKINSFQNDSLSLEMKINKMPFKMIFTKLNTSEE